MTTQEYKGLEAGSVLEYYYNGEHYYYRIMLLKLREEISGKYCLYSAMVLDYPSNNIYRRNTVYPWTIYYNDLEDWRLISK